MTLVYIGIIVCGVAAGFAGLTGHTIESAIYTLAALLALTQAEIHR